MSTPSPELMQRRKFLKLVTTLPALAAAAALVSPLLRFLKPNVEKFKIYAPTVQDAARGEVIAVATLKEVANPWDYKYFRLHAEISAVYSGGF